ncbi:5-deoxy-glucuronate isomerase [Lactococcus muris]|uniref:5-deoxy-glucuronate isomerase n=1 Tax=Lactococcus muris TaxID=2941330 RepID=A0ABV4D7K0_9LACT
MVNLKNKKIGFQINDKVELLHYISRENSHFDYIEVQVFRMAVSGTYSLPLVDKEAVVIAITGQYTVSDGTEKFENMGTRCSVFEKIPTDSVYIPNGKTISITATKPGKVMIAMSPTKDTRRKTCFVPARANSAEERGKYNNQRHVQNILDDQSPISEKLLLVEVYTPQANCSSYPPHRHDRENLPHETYLEEAYYHEVKEDKGFVFQRVYTDDHLIDETMTVYNEEMVQVPRGYHPVAVPDGYESYYLNVMAGPHKLWKFHNAPDHEWIAKRD